MCYAWIYWILQCAQHKFVRITYIILCALYAFRKPPFPPISTNRDDDDDDDDGQSLALLFFKLYNYNYTPTLSSV